MPSTASIAWLQYVGLWHNCCHGIPAFIHSLVHSTYKFAWHVNIREYAIICIFYVLLIHSYVHSIQTPLFLLLTYLAVTAFINRTSSHMFWACVHCYHDSAAINLFLINWLIDCSLSRSCLFSPRLLCLWSYMGSRSLRSGSSCQFCPCFSLGRAMLSQWWAPWSGMASLFRFAFSPGPHL